MRNRKVSKFEADLCRYVVRCGIRDKEYKIVGLKDGEYFLRIPKEWRKEELLALVAEFFDEIVRSVEDVSYIQLLADNEILMKYEYT